MRDEKAHAIVARRTFASEIGSCDVEKVQKVSSIKEIETPLGMDDTG